MDLDFFDLQYRFIRDNTNEIVYNANPNLSEWNTKAEYPNIWKQADAIAKSLYSVALADLGQSTPSILTNTTALQHYTEDFSLINNLIGVNTKAGPAKDSYENLKQTTGPLETSPAVFSAKYLCQVPRRKAMGSLLMTILLANLVLLQATWTLLSFFASLYVERVDKTG